MWSSGALRVEWTTDAGVGQAHSVTIGSSGARASGECHCQCSPLRLGPDMGDPWEAASEGGGAKRRIDALGLNVPDDAQTAGRNPRNPKGRTSATSAKSGLDDEHLAYVGVIRTCGSCDRKSSEPNACYGVGHLLEAGLTLAMKKYMPWRAHDSDGSPKGNRK